MKEKWVLLKSRFESFEMRERLLIVGAVAALVYLLWDFLLLQPMGKEMQIIAARERVARQAIQTTNAEITVLQNIAKKDPNSALRREIDELRGKLASLDQQLDTLAVGLVPAQQLPEIMHNVLSKTGKLTIERLTTLPPQELALSTGVKVDATAENATAEVPPPSQQDVKIYKHSVILNVAGDFAGVVQYLRELERSDWRFYWDSLSYKVTGYPNAKVRIRVFTLSSQRGVLDGV
jgi:MSHA biogenesis protein MshJ